MQSTYIQVLLPLKLDWIPFYRAETSVGKGCAVDVVFSGREYTGIVWSCGSQAPELSHGKIRDILRIREDLPHITPQELGLWEFLWSYYMCTPGEVFKAACPALRIKGENLFSSRIRKLRDKLGKTEEQLKRKHCERVRLRLEESVRELTKELECLTSHTPLPVSSGAASRPVLIEGSSRLGRYRELISGTLEKDMQVLVLTPEIAFCNLMAQELGKDFGYCLHCIHGERSASYRQAVSQVLRNGTKALVVGTRSSVFLPFTRLGLVIIDEEQDTSYKQEEPSPRYNARDTAIYLASLHGADTVLGSTLPSLESLLNCRNGKYRSEHTGHSPARAQYIDISAEKRKNGMLGPISRKLAEEISSAGCRALLLRGWEDRQELETRIREVFADADVLTGTLPELKRCGTQGAGIIAVLQIEAFCCSDDFRSDEKALQLIAMLGSMAPKVIVQTSVPARFVPDKDLGALLGERRDFSFPPFTRLVEIRRHSDGSVMQRFFLPKDSTLQQRKREIAASVPEDCYVDVDPM